MNTIFIKGKNQHVFLSIGEEIIEKTYSGMSNNQCEWMAVIDALKYMSGLSLPETTIGMDSLLVYKQLNFIYHTKSPNIKPMYFQWNQLKNTLSGHSITYQFMSGFQNPARAKLQEAYP